MAQVKPSPAWASIMPPQPVATVEIADLLAYDLEGPAKTLMGRAEYYTIEWPLTLRSYNLADDADAILARHFPRSPDGQA